MDRRHFIKSMGGVFMATSVIGSAAASISLQDNSGYSQMMLRAWRQKMPMSPSAYLKEIGIDNIGSIKRLEFEKDLVIDVDGLCLCASECAVIIQGGL